MFCDGSQLANFVMPQVTIGRFAVQCQSLGSMLKECRMTSCLV
jgi:hypothetical protein